MNTDSDGNVPSWTTAHKSPDGTRNKFRDPLRTLTHPGFFALQTHGKPVSYRNIRVKPLTALAKCPKCGTEAVGTMSFCAGCGLDRSDWKEWKA